MNDEEALKLATQLHKGQKRKYSGLPYITHPIAVANLVPSHYRVSAILHDVIEDTDMTIDCLQCDHGLSNHDALALSYLTRNPSLSYTNYIKRFAKNDFARQIKIADIRHNLSDLKDQTIIDKYELALELLTNM